VVHGFLRSSQHENEPEILLRATLPFSAGALEDFAMSVFGFGHRLQPHMTRSEDDTRDLSGILFATSSSVLALWAIALS